MVAQYLYQFDRVEDDLYTANMFNTWHVNGNYRKYAVTKFGFPVGESDNNDDELMCGEFGNKEDIISDLEESDDDSENDSYNFGLLVSDRLDVTDSLSIDKPIKWFGVFKVNVCDQKYEMFCYLWFKIHAWDMKALYVIVRSRRIGSFSHL